MLMNFTIGKVHNRESIYSDDNIFAGFAHIHFYANTNFADNWIKKCVQRSGNKKI